MRPPISALAVCCLLSGCATATYNPPVTVFDPVSCGQMPNLANAASLTTEKKKKVFRVDQMIGMNSDCIMIENRARPYAIFELPAVAAGKMIEVGAAIEPDRVVPPEIFVLDSQGTIKRKFEAKEIKFRGPMLSAQMLPEEGDSFLMVTVNPDTVGKNYDAIETGTSTTSIYTGYGVSNWTSGLDQNRRRGYSYVGSVAAIVYQRPD